MSRNLMTRSILSTLLVAGLAACDRGTSAPLAPVLSADLARVAAPARGGVTPPTVEGVRVCRADELTGLTERQIEAIRALYAAFYKEVADDLRYIQQVEQQAREAAAAGAPTERIRQILAQADEAKAHVAAAEQRLREAIDDVLNSDPRERHCVAAPVPVRPNG